MAQTKIKLNDRKKSTYATKRKIQGGKPTEKRLKTYKPLKSPSPSILEEFDDQTGKLNYDNDETMDCDTNEDPKYIVRYFHGSLSTFLLFQIPETLNSDTHQFVKTSASFTYGGQHGIWYALGFCSLSCGNSK